ncbi:unnamed protein product, partial [Ixodes hexagonus]
MAQITVTKTVTRMRRTRKKETDPNPLFTKWLREWKDEAVANNRKTQHVFAKALRSLKKYPLVLQSGKEAKILEFFGDKLCAMLDKKLEQHRRAGHGTSLSSPAAVLYPHISDGAPTQCSSQSAGSTVGTSNGAATKTAKAGRAKARGPRQYIPLPRSGAHAVLLTLARQRKEPLRTAQEQGGDPSRDWLTKSQLLLMAQPLCDASFTVPPADSHYTAWSSMATLLRKGLVSKQGCPAKYSLTDDGQRLASLLLEPGKNSSQDALENPAEHLTSSAVQGTLGSCSTGTSLGSLMEMPRSLEVLLLVDCGEACAGSQERLIRELRTLGVAHEVRRLSVGDFAWVGRSRSGLACREWLLGPLVERKRTDDLAKSIQDGRFHEQKVRLVASGLSPLVYLVEDAGGNGGGPLPEAALRQAVLNTQVSDGFLIKSTRDQGDTARFLSLVSRHLERQVLSRPLTELLLGQPTWEEFSASSVKNKGLQVREMLAKHLLQIKGFSLDRVSRLVQEHPSPAR